MSDYVFNCATLEPVYEDRNIAASHLVQLLQGLALLDAQSEILPTLRLPDDPWMIALVRDPVAGRDLVLGEIADGFYGTINHEHARFFESLNRAIPADHGLGDSTIDSVLGLEPDEPAAGFEATFSSVEAASFDASLCAVTGSVLASLLRDPRWDFDQMGFCALGSAYSFDHVAKSSHAESVNTRQAQHLRDSLTARNFWSSKHLTFPNLLFGLDVPGQLAKFNAKLMPLLFRRLAELNDKARVWRGAATAELPAGPPEVARESKATMDRFTEDRRFRGHDGKMRTFEEHVWVDRTHRIHIFCDAKMKTLEIGYVGHHLPTSTSPT